MSTSFGMQTRVYKRAGELEIHADVYPTPSEGPAPVVLLLHAGTLIAGGRSWFARYQLDMYRRAGFTVVAIDYRLAPETKAPAIVEDVLDAARWIRTELPESHAVDPSRLAIVGHSAGGYLTLLCGPRVRPRPRALVAFYGYGDITGEWYAKPDPHYLSVAEVTEERARRVVGTEPFADGSRRPERLDFYVRCRQQGSWLREVFDHPAGAPSTELTEYCPARTVTADHPPTLLLHGDADTDVPYDELVHMAAALAARGVEHELVTVAGAGHTFDLPAPYRFRAGGILSTSSPWLGKVASLLPRTTFRGPAPARGKEATRKVVAFLERHLVSERPNEDAG